MKKKETTRAMLGLTQQEMAMLLNVSRSQWSMYEMGSRNLPTTAGLRLSEMLTYMLSPEGKESKGLLKTDYEDKKTKQVLEKRLKENEFQQLVITKKINKAQGELEKYEKAVQLMDFLNSPTEAKKAAAPEILGSIATRAVINYRETKSEWNLLLIDLELLQQQQQGLQKALQKS